MYHLLSEEHTKCEPSHSIDVKCPEQVSQKTEIDSWGPGLVGKQEWKCVVTAQGQYVFVGN